MRRAVLVKRMAADRPNLFIYLFVGAKNEEKVTGWQEENCRSNHGCEDIQVT